MNSIRQFVKAAAIVIVGAVLLAPAAQAERDWRGGHPGFHRGPGPGWRGDFHPRDIDRWHGGRWYHGAHGDRLGWWWIVGGLWYFYPTPVYPYPDPYVPPVVVDSVPPAGQYWYYCPRYGQYYPYTQTCPVPWQPVPAR